ncbi:hypothetical protein CONPUDRAFT_90635 [Coniophora puteana RWD-64-598 SS2]|uniref:Uncharacterized protein n=1 Tax=Coniophora puteana (strain RWD-64-598) TaxID=741705 RepID=A0A5M3MN02_CONPW|nr:uncharacterized protein CONPUDRAFT_90635 [Coniophora puteana RWD-64-598 SS2]EIW80406.1 hypothetical protein CONPUDRAFT_90635 [Coniophora puteana RWD-64-598 SS2]
MPSRIPLNAFLGGPIVGGEYSTGDTALRSVSQAFFEQVCPEPVVMRWEKVADQRMWDEYWTVPASHVLDVWLAAINAIEEPCLMIAGDTHQIIEHDMFGQKDRLLGIWPALTASPILKAWTWSSLVYGAFAKNIQLFTSPPLFGTHNQPEQDAVARQLAYCNPRSPRHSRETRGLPRPLPIPCQGVYPVVSVQPVPRSPRPLYPTPYDAPLSEKKAAS